MARAHCGRCDSTSQGHQWASSRLCVSGSVGLAGHLLWSRPRRARMRGQTVAYVTGPFPASSDLLGVRAVHARAGGLCAVAGVPGALSGSNVLTLFTMICRLFLKTGFCSTWHLWILTKSETLNKYLVSCLKTFYVHYGFLAKRDWAIFTSTSGARVGRGRRVLDSSPADCPAPRAVDPGARGSEEPSLGSACRRLLL